MLLLLLLSDFSVRRMSFICPLVYRTLSPLLEEEEERDEEKLFKRGVLHITSPCSQQ